MCRISKDARGRVEGVKAQEKWGRDYAASTWPGLPVRVFADNNLSAANGDHRPEFEAFREAVAAGEVAQVWAVEQSRLERREVEWFQLAAELDAAGIIELHTNRDGIVRVRDEVAGIKAVLNAGEVRKLKRRINDKLGENAALGKPSGSRPFGYAHGTNDNGEKTYVIVSEQAEAIRWAADKALAGWSLTSIATDLRARGLHGGHRVKVRDEHGEVVTDVQDNPVTRPSTITAGTVKSMLTNPTIAGHRVHRGRIVGPGNWEPILDEQTWQAVKAKLSGSRVVRRADGGTYPITAAHNGNATGRRYLLTGGLAGCGVCAAPVCGSVKQMRNSKGMYSKPYLLCHPRMGGRSCVGIMLPETEQYVVDRLFTELDKPEFRDAVAADIHAARRDQITAGLAELERQRDELAGYWSLPPSHPDALTSSEWQTARRNLAEQEQELRRELAAVPPPLVKVDITTARQEWPSMTLDEQREFIRLFVAKVTINRAKPGTKGFDSDRVDIEWRKR